MDAVYSKSFDGKVAVITGAARGIGKALAEQLEALGAIVVSLDLQFENKDLQKYGGSGSIWTSNLDVSDQVQVKSVIASIEAKFGSIDFLVHSAGLLHAGDVSAFRVNTHGAFFVCTETAHFMKKRRSGSMVVIGSNASSTPRIGMGAYASSKAATTMMLKCLALELAQFNIRCNVVAPGSTDTEMQRQLWSSDDDSNKVIRGSSAHYRLGIPLGRIAKPEQIVHSVVFLLSDLASHISMEVLRVDGGATLGSN